MKVLLFYPWIKTTGGGEKNVLEYVRRSRHKIAILTWQYYPDKTFPEFKEVKVIQYPKIDVEPIARAFLLRGVFFGLIAARFPIPDVINRFDMFLIATAGIAELILKYHKIEIPKVLYCLTPLRAAYIWDIWYNLKYRYASRLKTMWYYKAGVFLYNRLEKDAWKRVNFAIFNSELSRKRAMDKKLIPFEKTDVIYPGVELREFEVGEPEDYILYVARFGVAKRHHVLIMAFHRFIKKHPECKYKLVLAGAAFNKKYLRMLKRLVVRLGLQKRVKFVENAPFAKLRELYAHAKVFVHPPYMEDFGIVPFEAAAAGRFIINVYPAGNYELLKDAPGILWVKERYKDETMEIALAKALEEFYKNEKEYVERGLENRDYIKKLDVSWDRFAKEMDKRLKEIYNEFWR